MKVSLWKLINTGQKWLMGKFHTYKIENGIPMSTHIAHFFIALCSTGQRYWCSWQCWGSLRQEPAELEAAL